ncbi:GNAT family N-acetyltransferase [Burkholderia contaminans]|nr:GNAT family N-acetyltransferase [Burkholderia contaminans]
MQVRPISSGELDQLLLLYRHLHATDEPLPDESVIRIVWNELMANSCHTLFGGYVDGELISSCALTIIPNLTRGCRPYGVLENVVTHGDHRGNGYGKAVLREALASSWSAGCYKVMLLTGRKDQATLNFYASAGFNGDEKRAFIAKPEH